MVVLGVILLTRFADTDLLKLLAVWTASKAQQIDTLDSSQPRAIAVRTRPVHRGGLEHRIGLTSDIAPEISVQVFSKVAGVLEELTVETGDHVQGGQVLGRIEWRELAARVDQAAALERLSVEYTGRRW